MPEFSDRVVLITGASGGLGEVVTQRFLAEGAAVAGVARSWQAAPAAGNRFMPIRADLTAANNAEDVVRQVVERWGRIDALAHLVGGFAGGEPVARTGDEVWERMLSLNLRAANSIFRAVLPPMLERGRGRIVAVGSRAGAEPAARLGAYSASKAALHALVRCLAEEVKDTGITVNAVLPSVIDTPANRAAMPGADASRWVRPESIAELIVWLASDAAADINGALVPVYGKA